MVCNKFWQGIDCEFYVVNDYGDFDCIMSSVYRWNLSLYRKIKSPGGVTNKEKSIGLSEVPCGRRVSSLMMLDNVPRTHRSRPSVKVRAYPARS